MSQITDFKAKVDGQFAAINTALDNVTADEAQLQKKIADLAAQIAAGQSTLTPEDQAALDAVVVEAGQVVARTQAVADAVPDVAAVS